MCRHGRFITNRYDGREYWVTCGHCPACLQEKSLRRIARIKQECEISDVNCFFVTFSYTNDNIPYIKESEYREFFYNRFGKLNVYRGNEIIKQLDYSDFDCRGKSTLYGEEFPKLKYLRKKGYSKYFYLYDRVGVLWLDDFQRFFKRLLINLNRLGYDGYLSYYYTGEYGNEASRSHVHSLIYFSKGFDDVVRRAIVKSWHYSDLSKPFRQKDGSYRLPVEVAKNPARYVSSYLNKSPNVPRVLSDAKPFKVFYHFSQGFGHNKTEFALASLLENVNQGHMYYNQGKIRNGCLAVSSAPIPDYIINKYWPKFKGFRLLSSDEVIDLVRAPQGIFFNRTLQDYLTFDEKYDIYSKLLRVRVKIPRKFYHDWLLAYSRVWSIKASDSIRRSYDDVRSPFDIFQHFLNIYRYFDGIIDNRFLDDLIFNVKEFEINPNNFASTISRDEMLMKSYHDDLNHHLIKNMYNEAISCY